MTTTELQRQHAHVLELRRKFSEPTKTIRRADYDAMATELRTTIAALEKAERDVEWTKRLLDDARSKISRLEGELEAIDLIGIDRSHIVPIRDVIVSVLARYPQFTWDDIIGRRGDRLLIEARFVCIAEANKARPKMSTPILGRIFNRDHSSIIHALKMAKERGWV